MGNPIASSPYSGTTKTYDSCNTPICYCQQAYEFNNVKCKWVSDNSSSEGGYCVDSSEKTCADSCDRCYSRTGCLETGRSALNASGSCSWSNSNSETDGTCSKTGSSSEVCWDSIDNDNDNAIDCADSECYTDSFCGFISGDCFGWNATSCPVAQLSDGKNCTWVTDPWGSWCDFPGADCWKGDGNETLCDEKPGCEWNNGVGTGWCEQDWGLGEGCYIEKTEANCIASASNCSWTNDTWCSGDGSNTEWCQDQGGWCDPAAFAPKNCWQYDDNATECNEIEGCYHDGSWCMEQGCWNYDSNKSACLDASDCSWENNEWGDSCDVDWNSMDCWKYEDNSSYCAANGCVWMGSNWCGSPYDQCWQATSSATCANYPNHCSWNYQWNSCEPICFNLDKDDCTSYSGCRLSEGWCMSDMMGGGSSGGLDCWEYEDDTTCTDTSGCKWKNPGWCNPSGFAGGNAASGSGAGAQTGMECWKYDGNESLCTNSTRINMTCSWMSEFRPFCDVDWSSDCWQYDWNSTACDDQANCYWNVQSNYCSNVFDQCWNNQTLQNNQTKCNNNTYCNWSQWNNCEPTCFNAQTQGECTGSCNWITGWCNPPGMGEVFNGMEMGAPVMVAFDDCMGLDTGVPDFVDLCGVGMKKTDNGIGFGAGVTDFSGAGTCNQEKLSKGGFGSGNETVRYYIYLDTDGNQNGTCRLSHDSSLNGYEFFFKLISSFNQSSASTTNTFNAYKCSSGEWVAADIGLSTWKQKMCGEINGPIIMVDTSDLSKFPTLYDSESDMRIFAAIADSNHNASNPSDTAGPGWGNPGGIDFPIAGFFEYGADSAIFEDIMKKGYVEYEDCFNSIDDDNDDLVDCDDWDCEFTAHCVATGVNADDYVDSSMPKITGIKIEEYTDAALVMYNTNKPTNGTLTFWYNDSSCTNSLLNATVYDSTIKATVRNYTSWHYASIYNDTGINSLTYPLTNDTTYYYKIKICDSGGKCSISACSSLRTAENTRKCGYCNFVTQIKPPAGWKVSYDLNSDGTYEHTQGQMCGPKAGMKTNYTSGRTANIKINNSDGGVMWFYNVSLTKTGLTSDTRDIENSNSLIFNNSLTDTSGNAVGLVGMISNTRDKIVNNLHPEICKIRIPGDCDALWHCDDNGDNCAQETSATGVVDGSFCIWTLPYCEFSTWASGEPGTYTPPAGPGGGSSGGGGGGVLGFWSKTYLIGSENFTQGYTKRLSKKHRMRILVNGETHYVGVVSMTETTATINISSDPVTATLSVGDERKFDVTGDNFYDVNVILNSIVNGTEADITVKSINEAITSETTSEEEKKEGAAAKERDQVPPEETQDTIKEKEGLPTWAWIVIIIIVILILAGAGVGGAIAVKNRK